MPLTALDLPDRHFDAVCCLAALAQLPEPALDGALAELRRVCAGILVVMVPFRERLPIDAIRRSRFDEQRLLELLPPGRDHPAGPAGHREIALGGLHREDAMIRRLFQKRPAAADPRPVPAAAADPAAARERGTYWSRRQGLMYYQYVDEIVRSLGAEAKSLIDIGSANASYTENFDWIGKRHALDIRKPYSSDRVKGIRSDFFSFQPDERYDFALCLQVLEHIPDAKRFAHRLFEIADRVLISVPFMWPAGSNKEHVHDPVSLEKVVFWTGRLPDYHVVVTEPLRDKKASRLIAYFHPEGVPFSVPGTKAARPAPARPAASPDPSAPGESAAS